MQGTCRVSTESVSRNIRPDPKGPVLIEQFEWRLNAWRVSERLQCECKGRQMKGVVCES